MTKSLILILIIILFISQSTLAIQLFDEKSKCNELNGFFSDGYSCSRTPLIELTSFDLQSEIYPNTEYLFTFTLRNNAQYSNVIVNDILCRSYIYYKVNNYSDAEVIDPFTLELNEDIFSTKIISGQDTPKDYANTIHNLQNLPYKFTTNKTIKIMNEGYYRTQDSLNGAINEVKLNYVYDGEKLPDFDVVFAPKEEITFTCEFIIPDNNALPPFKLNEEYLKGTFYTYSNYSANLVFAPAFFVQFAEIFYQKNELIDSATLSEPYYFDFSIMNETNASLFKNEGIQIGGFSLESLSLENRISKLESRVNFLEQFFNYLKSFFINN